MFASLIRVSKKTLSLPLKEKILYWNVCRALIRVRRDLSRKPFPSVLSRVKRSALRPVSDSDDARFDVATVCRAVERTARYLPGRYLCLPQALVGYAICSRYGSRPALRVGVNRTASETLHAHAWLEYNGAVVLGDLPDLSLFRVFEKTEELVL